MREYENDKTKEKIIEPKNEIVLTHSGNPGSNTGVFDDTLHCLKFWALMYIVQCT